MQRTFTFAHNHTLGVGIVDFAILSVSLKANTAGIRESVPACGAAIHAYARGLTSVFVSLVI